MTQPFGRALLGEWLIEKNFTFLNHGSFGAVPRAVLSAQNDWRIQLERQPVRFINETLEPALRAAADRLTHFVGAPPGSLVFVANSTEGINAVSRSLNLVPGDEVLVTDQAYRGALNALSYDCERAGAKLRIVRLPWPTIDEKQVLDAVDGALSDRIRFAVLDHISSHHAVMMPIKKLVEMCRARSITVIVDGAHAPGMIALDIADVGAAWYVGNGHKWLCAPKGCALLSVSGENRSTLHPAVISTPHGEGFWEEFAWTGTRDTTSWMSVTAAIDFWQDLGVHAARTYISDLANWAGDELVARWGTERGASSELTAAMVTVRVPGNRSADQDSAYCLHEHLLREHQIEVPVFPIDDALWLRVSTQVYNCEADVAHFASALS